jgi:hypothetical protein
VESGRKKDRPQLATALAACRAGCATLVIAKLDRLARNVAFVLNLMESSAEFVAADMPSVNRLTIHVGEVGRRVVAHGGISLVLEMAYRPAPSEPGGLGLRDTARSGPFRL